MGDRCAMFGELWNPKPLPIYLYMFIKKHLHVIRISLLLKKVFKKTEILSNILTLQNLKNKLIYTSPEAIVSILAIMYFKWMKHLSIERLTVF